MILSSISSWILAITLVLEIGVITLTFAILSLKPQIENTYYIHPWISESMVLSGWRWLHELVLESATYNRKTQNDRGLNKVDVSYSLSQERSTQAVQGWKGDSPESSGAHDPSRCLYRHP